MDLAQVIVDKDEAQAKVAEYERLIAAERTAEDRGILQAYRAAARGLGVISLPRTIAAGGFFDNSLPRLAVIRATATACFAWWDGSSVIYSEYQDWRANQGALVNEHTVRVPLAGDDLPRRRAGTSSAGETIVPVVPPDVRPRLRRLRGCHILWEVESWTPIPPRDPALIRHIRGDLWAVLAVWDLTELERLVLSQRR